ncbi:MAG: hypothetical protein RL173_742 [Fibrobacterota bacterium]
MAVKKSDLYSSIWASCDQLRGGMDASLYKNYVLSLLFIKYITDKYGNSDDFDPLVKIPAGASFHDMKALRGKSDIGDKINTQIIQPLIDANPKLSRNDFPNFNDPDKLGEGPKMVNTLSNLISIFAKPELDFSNNRAEHDDLLGDAYEYLMRHFATESGKSKGQFYTPSEVSSVVAKVLGITPEKSVANTRVYDPTCGSGSLLLKVAAEAGKHITLEGQEKDVTTAGLARMNMILHNFPTATILSGDTLNDPKFKVGEMLRVYDYVVANPPFSDKAWSSGMTAPIRENDPYQRFEWGEPPAKQGDYAFLLHIVRSMKGTGKGACILPHGVLFRGNAEAVIREKLVKSGILKGIIGLPANLFYGTGIPACILVLDKENATARKGIFLIDASKGFIKDGPKNRLRDQDIHKIVDTFTKLQETPKFARMVELDEIEKNDFNLNLPRYIDSSEPEELQDIEGHLQGGIPDADVKSLAAFWEVCPSLKSTLFKKNRPGYQNLKVSKSDIKTAIFAHPEFASFTSLMEEHFETWKKSASTSLKKLAVGDHPKHVIQKLSEKLLEHYADKPLVDKYDIYQHLMDYWTEVMQDDFYQIVTDGWVAKTYRIIEKDKNGKEKDKGWTCDLIPKALIVARFFAKEQAAIDTIASELESLSARMTELEEEHGGEEGLFCELEKVNKAEVSKRLKEIKGDKDAKEEEKALKEWQKLSDQEAELKPQLKRAEADLDAKARDKYPSLTESDIKTLVVSDKWLATLEGRIHGDMDRISQQLTSRVKELAERYETPLPKLTDRVAELEAKVAAHLAKMGFTP